MQRQIITYITRICVVIFFLHTSAYATSWRTIAPGVEYRDLGKNTLSPWSHIHAFKIDLKKNTIDSMMARNFGRSHASAETFVKQSHALIALNAGFFDQTFQPLGLRIGHQQTLSPLKRISWWGVFYINNNKAYLTTAAQFKPNKHIQFAVQSGPRLIINGSIPVLKPGYAERSALGITADGHMIILVTENAAMTTTTLAQFMQNHPLNCRNALNLDGGSSSQLRADIGSFQINEYGYSNVSDAILVFKGSRSLSDN